MTQLVEHHRRACSGFASIAAQFEETQWELPTPCTDWDTRALVEHVIGFHDFLLLRPLGVRANRPKTGPAERWSATADALFAALDIPGAVDRETELPGGGTSTARAMLGTLTTEVLVHTWDLARAASLDPALDEELCTIAYDSARAAGMGKATDMFRSEVAVAAMADASVRLIALCGRDPEWEPPPR